MTTIGQAGWQVAAGRDIALISFDADGPLQLEWHAGRFTIRTDRGEIEDLRDAIDVALGRPAQLKDTSAAGDADEAPLQLDPRTVELAGALFRDHPLGTDENVQRLAQAIQDAAQETVLQIEQDADK